MHKDKVYVGVNWGTWLFGFTVSLPSHEVGFCFGPLLVSFYWGG